MYNFDRNIELIMQMPKKLWKVGFKDIIKRNILGVVKHTWEEKCYVEGLKQWTIFLQRILVIKGLEGKGVDLDKGGRKHI